MSNPHTDPGTAKPLACCDPEPGQPSQVIIYRRRETVGDRARSTEMLAALYTGEQLSIRAVATPLNRSYGFVHTRLRHTGTSLRSRGERRQPHDALPRCGRLR